MHLVLSFAESEVSSVTAGDHGLHIRLSAASVESVGVPGSGPAVAGYAIGVVLRLPGFQVLQRSEPTFRRIRSGALLAQGQSKASCALPVEYNMPVQLELVFANGASMLVSASAFGASFEGEPNFQESLAC